MSDIVKEHTTPLGASGTDVVGKIHNANDSIDALRGDQAAQIYDKMRRSDTQVRKVLSSINNPIRTAEWRIDPASEEQVDIDAAALINQILFKDLDWSKFVNEALTCVPHGFSAFEVVHMNRDDKTLGTYTGLAQLGFRKQTTITEWNHNEITGALESIKQESNGDIKVNVIIPAEFLLLIYSEQEGDNIGFPLLRNLFGPYKRKLLALELQYIGIERFSIPTPIAKSPKNMKTTDVEYQAAITSLKNFVSAEDSFLIYPDGWDIQLHSNTYDPSKVQIVIKSENENMTGAILAGFLELGIGGNSGAFALSIDQSDFFLGGIEYFATLIVEAVNRHLIPNLMLLNFGDTLESMPELAYSGISDRAGKELMEVITGYTAAGVVSNDEQLEDHVRNVHKLPKKAMGELLDNKETQGDNNGNNGDDATEPDNEPDPNDNSDPSSEETQENNTSLKLSEHVGHTHKGTGPAIARGQKHFHEVLDAQGNSIGRTQTSKPGAGHTHDIDGDTETGKPIQTKEDGEATDNPKKLIDNAAPRIAKVLRDNLDEISSKYIADVTRKYKTLPEKSKLKSVQGLTIKGLPKFRKELKAALTESARRSLDMVKREVPTASDVKLSENVKDLPNFDTFKFNDFSSLPRRIQLLIANQVKLISDKEASEVVDSVALQFTSTESSTNDIDVIRQDLENQAQQVIDSGNRDRTANNLAATTVNEARNTFLFDDDVIESIASFTFINFDPKADICKTLAGTTYNVNDSDLVRFQPPLHHNCKSYLRANLKTKKNQPDVTGLPPISESAQKSITLGEK